MNILITGYSGFIGRNLISELSKNDSYKLFLIGKTKNKLKLNKKNIIVLSCDLEKLEDIKKIIDFKPDIAFHLAWKGIPLLNTQNSFDSLSFSIKFFELIFNLTDCKKIIVSGSCNGIQNLKALAKKMIIVFQLLLFMG